MIRSVVVAAAAAGIALTPLEAAPAANAKPSLKSGPAHCRVNQGGEKPCTVRKSQSGSGFDVEIGGDQPMLALIDSDGVYLFALIGEERTRVPLYGEYAVDPKHPDCWSASDEDTIVASLCVR